MAGIEPASSAWKAEVIASIRHPLTLSDYLCSQLKIFFSENIKAKNMVEGGGFEPPKAEPSDLQSDPFGHSGTPPIYLPTLPKQVVLMVPTAGVELATY